jgi:hypothetical protein
VDFRPFITAPVGLYTFIVQGKEGALISNAYFRKPDGPRLLQLDDQHDLLIGFLPQEKVRLFSYQSDEYGWTGRLAAWQEYQVNQEGRLKIKVPSEVEEVVAVGSQSGEAHLLIPSIFGGAFDPIEEKILRQSVDTIGTHYLDCSVEMALQSRLRGLAKIKITNSDIYVYANPRREARIVQTLPVGLEVPVTGGPYCSGNFIWWKVAYEAHSFYGYMLEFDGQKYYLNP